MCQALDAHGVGAFVYEIGPPFVLGADVARRRELRQALRSLQTAGYKLRAVWGRVWLPSQVATSSVGYRVATDFWIVDDRSTEPADRPSVNIGLWEPIGPVRSRLGHRSLERLPLTSTPQVDALPGGRPFIEEVPTASDATSAQFDIDLVFTWVDDSDPAWQAQRARFALPGEDDSGESSTTSATASDGRSELRFRNRDELRYALRSVYRYADWARHIFIVTAGQTPSWLTDHPKISVVPHTDILDEHYVPTFNSHAIESALHRIPGLAEHFVYFNDDVMLCRPTWPSTFFAGPHLPKVFLSRDRIPTTAGERHTSVYTAGRNAAELVQREFGRVPMFVPKHAPFALTKELMGAIEERFGPSVAATRSARFRSDTDISTAANMAGYVALLTGSGVTAELSAGYVSGGTRARLEIDTVLAASPYDTICVNDAGPATDQMVNEFLRQWMPYPAPWEHQ
uniref:Uncharacterized protein n=1 Tax=uncultured bacterium A1Q1_fos_15 TaxID=1256548 RepID=L7VXM9_9BACT|nr:hypothetical protein [uncultured bacterium A1Q1_fos_15]